MRARWMALAAALLAGCAPFASDRPIYPVTEGVAAFGTAPGRLTLQAGGEDDRPVRGRLTFADGQYRLKARDPESGRTETLPFSLHPMPDIAPTGAFFIVQAEHRDDDAPAGWPPAYVFEILRLTPEGFWVYGVDCGQLDADERVALGFMTAEEAAAEATPPERMDLFQTPSCSVASRDQIERAFDILARRQRPQTFGTFKPGR